MPGGKRFFAFERTKALPSGREYTPSGARLNIKALRFNSFSYSCSSFVLNSWAVLFHQEKSCTVP